MYSETSLTGLWSSTNPWNSGSAERSGDIRSLTTVDGRSLKLIFPSKSFKNASFRKRESSKSSGFDDHSSDYNWRKKNKFEISKFRLLWVTFSKYFQIDKYNYDLITVLLLNLTFSVSWKKIDNWFNKNNNWVHFHWKMYLLSVYMEYRQHVYNTKQF